MTLHVCHKILKKEKENRVLDKYVIYNYFPFHKKIRYLFIGYNPSASNDDFTDDTNLWIINWIINGDKSGGYYLTNLYSDVSSNSGKCKKDKNPKLSNILRKYKKFNICLFYGKKGASEKDKFDSESLEILKAAFESKRLFMTTDNNEFHHISRTSNALKIKLVKDLETVGLQ